MTVCYRSGASLPECCVPLDPGLWYLCICDVSCATLMGIPGHNPQCTKEGCSGSIHTLFQAWLPECELRPWLTFWVQTCLQLWAQRELAHTASSSCPFAGWCSVVVVAFFQGIVLRMPFSSVDADGHSSSILAHALLWLAAASWPFPVNCRCCQFPSSAFLLESLQQESILGASFHHQIITLLSEKCRWRMTPP